MTRDMMSLLRRSDPVRMIFGYIVRGRHAVCRFLIRPAASLREEFGRLCLKPLQPRRREKTFERHGAVWAINCDLPIWAEGARAFFPEYEWGMFVTGGVTALLPRIVGLNKAREMLILGERYSARDLLAAGVAWRVVPDDRLLLEARAVAEKIAGLPPTPLGDLKRVLRQVAQGDLEAALDLEAEATVRAFLDPETSARIAEFSRRS